MSKASTIFTKNHKTIMSYIQGFDNMPDYLQKRYTDNLYEGKKYLNVIVDYLLEEAKKEKKIITYTLAAAASLLEEEEYEIYKKYFYGKETSTTLNEKYGISGRQFRKTMDEIRYKTEILVRNDPEFYLGTHYGEEEDKKSKYIPGSYNSFHNEINNYIKTLKEIDRCEDMIKEKKIYLSGVKSLPFDKEFRSAAMTDNKADERKIATISEIDYLRKYLNELNLKKAGKVIRYFKYSSDPITRVCGPLWFLLGLSKQTICDQMHITNRQLLNDRVSPNFLGKSCE